MKVICAGVTKTGTKSLNAALQQLGYGVYDCWENLYYLHDDWNKAFDGKATKKDFERMFKDVDSGCDMPIYLYWEEILEAFPEAKVILSLRDEEEWFESLQKQMYVMRTSKMFLIPQFITPSGWRLSNYGQNMFRIFCGQDITVYKSYNFNKNLWIRGYRRHNATVMQRCPKDNLLVYHVKEGWEPLCHFLGVSVPNEPFPHKNIRGNMLEEQLATHPMFGKIKKELLLSLMIISASLFVGGFCAWKTKFWQNISVEKLLNYFKME